MYPKFQQLKSARVAVQVHSMQEKLAAEHLALRGYECFLPLQLPRTNLNSIIRWPDKLAPLFPGYLFCQYKTQYRFPIAEAPRCNTDFKIRCTPAAVPDDEVEVIVQIVNSGYYLEPMRFLQIGQRVRVSSGPLSGLEGMLSSANGAARVIINLTLLRRSVDVEVDALRIVLAEQVDNSSVKSMSSAWKQCRLSAASLKNMITWQGGSQPSAPKKIQRKIESCR